MSKPLVMALAKGRLMELAMAFFQEIGIESPELHSGSRKLMFDVPGKNIKILLVRAVDVATYVEHGAADIGIAGKDLLMEQMCDVYEPIDLGFGYCKIILAEPVPKNGTTTVPKSYSKRRIATKYPNITEHYFSKKGIPIEIVKLYGSIELAPLVGLADQIVDLTSTGATLKANNLRIVDDIAECTARVIVNRASLKLKYPEVKKIIDDIKGLLELKSNQKEGQLGQ